jgi:hypothetical protein
MAAIGSSPEQQAKDAVAPKDLSDSDREPKTEVLTDEQD